MTIKGQQNKKNMGAGILIRVVACCVILFIGFGVFSFLKSRKKAPSHTTPEERPLKVEVEAVTLKDVPVFIEAHGELRSIRTVNISAEVAGKVTELHPNLQTGELIRRGELLFAIDDRDYRSEYESNKKRLAILKRDKEISTKELARVRTLFEKKKVGTRAGVEHAEKLANSSADRLAQVEQAMVRAAINLERCRFFAPFHCRITSKSIEKGQYVAPGKVVMGLADDSILELEVPIDSRDVFQWLQFAVDESVENVGVGWFSSLTPVSCEVFWTENEKNRATALLQRVSSFDKKTRTVKVILQIDSKQFAGSSQSIPLVSGMFCRAVIPGRSMSQVVELPRRAVSFENTVYVVRNNRLETVPVKVVRVQDNMAYISEGLDPGDMVITTRLVAPLERSLVELSGTHTTATRSSSKTTLKE